MSDKVLSTLPSPVLAGVIRETTAAAARAEMKNCMYDGAQMIDLHLSCLEQTDVETLRKIIATTPLPVLALNYNQTLDWKDAGLTEEERVDSMLRALEAGAAGIDMQGYTFHRPSKFGFCGEDRYSFTKGNPKEVVTDPAVIEQQCQLIQRVHHAGKEVLLSCHPGIPMDRQQVVELALFLEQRRPDIIKIVTAAHTQDDLLESFKAMQLLKQEVKTPVSYHANGRAGSLSRLINPLLGGHIVFCVDRFNPGSTMEQLDLKTAKAALDSLKKFK